MSVFEKRFCDGLRLPIPRLGWEVLNHFMIAPTQIMPKGWRLLMASEVRYVQNQVMFRLHELLCSYFLKESDKDKGKYAITLKHDQTHVVTDLRSSDRN